jgi:hypothetical protein
MTRSEDSQSVVSEDHPELSWFEALLHYPSSFAAGLLAIRDLSDRTAPLVVTEEFQLVQRLVREGLVSAELEIEDSESRDVTAEDWARLENEYNAWLGDLSSVSPRDVVYDPLGLWLTLTTSGRQRWALLAEHDETVEPSPFFSLSFRRDSGLVIVRASSMDEARNRAMAFATEKHIPLDMDSESVSSSSGRFEVSYRVIDEAP